MSSTATTTAEPPATQDDKNVERPVLELIKHRGYWRWAAATTLLRMTPLMMPIAMILASMAFTGSPALGGLLVGVGMVPSIVAAPIAGRIMDRLGTAVWTPRLLIFAAIMRLGLMAGFIFHAPAPVLIIAMLAGTLATCGISGATRTLLRNTVPQRLMGTALSLDSVSAELVIITAPFIVVAIAVPGAAYPILLMSLTGVAAALLLTSRDTARQEATAKDEEAAKKAQAEAANKSASLKSASLWRNREFLFWMLVTVAFGQLMGTADLTALPIAALHGGGTAQGAMLVALLGAASAGAGLLYAWYGRRIKLSLIQQSIVLLLLMIGSIAFVAAGFGLIGLAVGFVIMGLWAAPLNTVMQEGPSTIVPPSRMTEAFNILIAAGALGFAAVGGMLSFMSAQQVQYVAPVTAIIALAAAPLLTGGRKNEPQAQSQTQPRTEAQEATP
ncbi:MAG TPA: MFS transporter [Candidatus Limnocylindrales bacterium]|nr:MFS transporter [Candidatus Limnocylindrales bacterium]